MLRDLTRSLKALVGRRASRLRNQTEPNPGGLERVVLGQGHILLTEERLGPALLE